MKPLSRTLLFTVVMSLLVVCPALAQEKQSQDTDLLRAKIEQFEETDINSKSSSVQSIYHRTLLRLYNQFIAALQQDITSLKAMEGALNGANSESQKEIALQLQKLARERDVVSEKIQTLTGEMKASVSTDGISNKGLPEGSNVAMRPARFMESNGSGAVNVSASTSVNANTNKQVFNNGLVANIATTDTITTQASPSPSPEPPIIQSEIKEGVAQIAGMADKGATVEVFINDASVGTTTANGDNGGFIKRLTGELRPGDVVAVRQKAKGATDYGLFSKQFVTPEERIDPYKGGAVGYLLGGAVFSQQGDQFNQADPFFGFIAGYSSFLRGSKDYPKDKWGNIYDIHGNRVRRCSSEDAKMYQCVGGEYYIIVRNDDRTQLVYAMRDSSGKLVPAVPINDTQPLTALGNIFVRAQTAFKRPSSYRWNWRFQGIFTAEPRTATPTQTATTTTTGTGTGTGTGGTGTGSGSANDSFKFISSRKSFDMETHAWIDFFPLNAFSIGPYAAIGASTAMSKNELTNEPTTVSNNTASSSTGTGSGTGTGTGSGTSTGTTVVTSAESDNDIKRYMEAGALSNIFLFNRKVYLQSIFAYGRYEALSDLGKPEGSGFFADSRNRFVGKLRIFPSGLHPGFGRQVEAAPMFGVEMNAGRGPDFLKFFVGYAIKIQKITGVSGVQ